MGNANAGGWRYTARYGWNWRSVRAIGGALGSLTRPTPPWFRAVVARCLLTRTALHVDAEGIWGSGGAAPAGPGGLRPTPWKDVTDIVVWDYNHLRIIGLARRGDAIGGGPAARALASRATTQARPPRRRAQLRHPSYAAFIAPDGSPYGAAYVVTANGWCVDTARLQAAVRHFAPHARFVNLSGVSLVPEYPRALVEIVFEFLAGVIEVIGGRRLGWLIGVAAAAAALAAAAGNLGTNSHAPIGVTVSALALVGLGWRAVAVRRRRRRAEHPEGWLESGREDAEGSRLAGLRRGRLAAWTLRGLGRSTGR
jgi:hypothetical protein